MFLGGAIHKARIFRTLSRTLRSSTFRRHSCRKHHLSSPWVSGRSAADDRTGNLTAALLLSGTMVVALATAAIPDHKIHANWRGLLDFLYLPEWLLLCLLGWLIFVGAGKLSLDHGLRRRVVRYLGSGAGVKPKRSQLAVLP